MPDEPTLDSKGFVSELAVAAAELFVAAVLPSTDTRFFALADREAKSGGNSSRRSFAQAHRAGYWQELASRAHYVCRVADAADQKGRL